MNRNRLIRTVRCRINSWGLIAALLVGGFTSAWAAPHTNHFDPLIAELQRRSDSLNNTTDKTELKLKKSLDKILASFAKPSTSLATDLKLAGTTIKSLVKLFPAEFARAGVGKQSLVITEDLNALAQQALAAFGNDINALVVTAQDIVNVAPLGSCRDKAQAALDAVNAELALLGSTPSLATSVTILAKAAKDALNGQKVADAAVECVPHGGGGGGGGGGNWYDWHLDMTVNGTPVSAYEDGQTGGPDRVIVTYFSTGGLAVGMTKQAGMPAVSFEATIGNPASGTHPISRGSYFDGSNYIPITSGTITITKWPAAFPDTGKATFSFTAGSVTVTRGSFTVWIYPPF